MTQGIYHIATSDEGVQFREVGEVSWTDLNPGQTLHIPGACIKDWEFHRTNGSAVLRVDRTEEGV